MIAILQRSASRQRFFLRRLMSTGAKYQPPFDPFLYTQGRWLNRDKERRDSRILRFDFDALLGEAIKCSPGARRVIDCEKREGGFNRVFMIHLDNQTTVVARLPTRLAGPPGLTVRSEVATLQFGIIVESDTLSWLTPSTVKQKTTVPVPSVLSWSAEPENSIGTEYMIQDLVPGIPLKDVWNNMTASQHVACIASMGRLCKQLCRLSFPGYGSLYLNSGAPSGTVKLDETFCIGPACAPQHWGCGIDSTVNAKPSSGFQGPWQDTESYFSDLIARVKSGLGVGPNESDMLHLKLLDTLQPTLSLLTTKDEVKTASEPILFHPDFHSRNIFVDAEDHTKVTGVIDWQSAAVEPAFVFAAETPDFAEELPDEDDPEDLTVEEKAAQAKLRADIDFCVKAWAVMQQTCENLRPASRLDSTLLHILAAPSFGWIDSEVILEMLLKKLADEWEDLGLPGQSIHQPSKAEDVVERLDEYQAKRRLQDHLTRLLGCDNDGWVPNDRWEEVLPRYRLEYSRFVRSVKEDEELQNGNEAMALETADRLWLFDQR